MREFHHLREPLNKPKKEKPDSKRVKKAAVIGAIVAAGGVGFETGRSTETSHILDHVPERIEKTPFSLAHGLDLTTKGISVMIDLKPEYLRIPSGKVIILEIPNRQEKPKISFEKNKMRFGQFVNESHTNRVQRFALQSEPSIIEDFSCTGGVCQWYTPLTLSIEAIKGDKMYQNKDVDIKQEALGAVFQNEAHPFFILADKPPRGDYAAMIDNIEEAATLARRANAFIDVFDKKDRLGRSRFFIEKVLLHQPLDSQIERQHSYSARYQLGQIRGSNQELGNRTLLLAGLLHEMAHFMAAGLDDSRKRKIEAAFSAYRRLGGHTPDESLVGKLFGPAEGTEDNPVYRIIDESTVFGLYAHTGHPYQEPHEMFASLTASLAYAPDRVEELLGLLPKDRENRFRNEVIKPCLQVYGNAWGQQLMGDSYKRFNK